MSKALELFFSELTPVQEAALEKIRDYKRELADHGIHMRSAMELEFMTQTADGTPVPSALVLFPFERHLKEETFPGDERRQGYVENLYYERIKTDGPIHERGKPETPYQYELKISEVEKDSRRFAPEIVAGITGLMKHRQLEQAMMHSSYLSPPVRDLHQQVVPNFTAHPYIGAHRQDETRFPHSANVSSALHVNVSLYDDKGNNLFVSSPDLLDHCVRSLIDVQHNATLPFLPHQNSLSRLSANNSAPHGIGANTDNKDNRGKNFISVNVRKYNSYKMSPEIKAQTRIENRLPGADADPLVSMAVTMAAMVDAVRHHHKGWDKGQPVITPSEKKPYDTHAIERSHDTLVTQFETAGRMKTLLGDKLYQGILNEYAAEPILAR